MRIHIREKDGRFTCVPIPAGLLFSPPIMPLVWLMARPFLKKAGLSISYGAFYRLLRSLRKAKRCLQGSPFLEICEQDGDQVTVQL